MVLNKLVALNKLIIAAEVFLAKCEHFSVVWESVNKYHLQWPNQSHDLVYVKCPISEHKTHQVPRGGKQVEQGNRDQTPNLGPGSGPGLTVCLRQSVLLPGTTFLIWKMKGLNHLGSPFCSPQAMATWLQDWSSERLLHSFSLRGQNGLFWPWLVTWVPASLSGTICTQMDTPVNSSTPFTLGKVIF